MRPDHEGFDQLVRRAQSGDRQAVNHLMAAVRPCLLGVAHEYADPLRASESASDLVQEAELRAWQKLEQFCGGESDKDTLAMFRIWMIQIVRRLGLNAQRYHSAQRRKAPRAMVSLRAGMGTAGSTVAGSRGDPPSKDQTPTAKLRSSERSQLIREALEAIPDPEERKIVQLYFFDELTLREISTRIGLSYEQTKERYRRGMRRLEQTLAHLK